jgi:hypothetical protein
MSVATVVSIAVTRVDLSLQPVKAKYFYFPREPNCRSGSRFS